MGERAWNVGDRVIVLSDEVNRPGNRHDNRTGRVAVILTNVDENPYGVAFDNEPADDLRWFEAGELGPAPARPAVEVWEWEHVPDAWRALWTERFPDGVFRYRPDWSFRPYHAVVSRPEASGLGRKVAGDLDVDGVQRFDLPNGDRLDVILVPNRGTAAITETREDNNR